jgi:hypothetical protein
MTTHPEAEYKDEYLRPSKADSDICISIEKSVEEKQRDYYMEWMSGRPMSERIGKSPRDERDGCILSWMFIRYCDRNKTQNSIFERKG